MTKSDKLGKDGGKEVLDNQINSVKVFMEGAGSLCIPVLHLVSSYAQQKGQNGYGIYELSSNIIFHLQQKGL